MPEEIIEAELWETFGTRSEYNAAPLWKAIRHRLRIIGKHKVEARQHAKQEAEIEERRRAAERSGGRR